jgi:hypothetical protein
MRTIILNKFAETGDHKMPLFRISNFPPHRSVCRRIPPPNLLTKTEVYSALKQLTIAFSLIISAT